MKPRRDAHTDSTGPFPDDPRVVEAMEEYLAELEAGRNPDRQRFLARRPEIAAALAECLDGLAFIHAAAPCLHTPNLAEAITTAGLGEVEPQPLGDFRIVRQIGRGGMGVVYEAVQLSLGRRVALKVLPLAATLDPKQLQRFKNEAQAAAQLHHTNIVPVYAVGSERSVHYYAMQLIEGQSLAAVIEEMRHPDGAAPGAKKVAPGPKRQQGVTTIVDSRPGDFRSSALGKGPRSGEFFRMAAALGFKAAEALEHAHELGVIHRDVKPANLLIDARGNLWVTDFGLALFQSDAGLTMTGEVLGTLRYMSPEQALGKRGVVDHRTDVYSLGVTLYELLTLQPAFNGQDRQELLTQITCDDPQPPRRLNPAIPVELETIVLKAMARSPADRYATAREMADDLQRFLEHRPILARRPSLRDRAVKWAWRHRGVVASAVVLLLMAVAGLLVATLLIAQEHAATRAAYERERQRAEEARAARARAQNNFRQARKAVDFLTQIGEEELANLPPGMRRRMLEVALSYYQDFLEQEQDPSIQAELEATWARVTRLLDELIALQGSGQLGLLKERAVQEELKMAPDQKTHVVTLADRQAQAWREAFKSFHRLEPEERRAKSLELARAEEGAINEVLDPPQETRFRQLVLQVQQRGRYGFSDPEIVSALSLTTKQREKIRGLLQTAYPAPWEAHFRAPAGGKGPPPKGRGSPPPPASWKGATAKVLNVFTEEQRGKWRELTGEPLAEEVQFAPPGGVWPGRGPQAGGHFGQPAGWGHQPGRPRPK
jgi:serine/threonine protein kinase